MRSMFCVRILQRFMTGSLLTSSPSGTDIASWDDFPPGAAHRSSSFQPGSISTEATGDMAPGSWI